MTRLLGLSLYLLLAVLVHTATSQTLPCANNGLCPNNTYCSETPSGIPNCIACDDACALTCDGPGPERCTACKVGYYKPPGIISPCTECPTGKFGKDCTSTCHCLNNELCNKNNGTCGGWKCDRGYTNIPFCQDICPAGTFGLDCASRCHCPVGDNCSNVNGDCSSGRCDPDYGGAACQRRLPKLALPPTVQYVSCNVIKVIWDAFNQSKDIGTGPVGQYQIYQKLVTTNTSISWVGIFNYTSDDTLRSYVLTVPRAQLTEESEYIYRVDVVGSDSGKLLRQVSSGPTSDSVGNTCRVTTVAPVVVSDQVFQSFTLRAVNSSLIQLDFTVLPDYTRYNYTLTLSRQLLGNGDCDDVTGSITSYNLNISQPPFAIANLASWSKYRIVVNATAVGVNVKEIRTQNVTTSAVVPEGGITNLTLESVTSTRAVVTWNPLPCSQRKGPLRSYNLYLEVVNTSNSNRSFLGLDTRYQFTDLLPYTNYSLQVAYNNIIGEGPLSQKFFFVTDEGAPSSVEIVSLIPTYSTIFVNFTPPVNKNGVLTMYMVTFSESASFTASESVNVPASADLRTVVVERLKPMTTYFLKMSAKTSAATGLYGNTKSVTTLQSPPSADTIQLTMTSHTLNCLTLEWALPKERTDNATHIVLEVRKATVATIVKNVTLNSTDSSYQLCDLKPSTFYVVTITGFKGQDVLARGTETFSTEHGTPPVPVAPVFVRSTYTNFTVTIEPVVSDGAPVTGYQLMLQKVAATKRKKRVAGVPGTVVAELTTANVTRRREFVIGDNQTYGQAFNKELEANTLYMLYYVVLSTFNQNTTFSFSKLKDPVRTIPFDPSLAPPIPLAVTDKNTTCLNISWSVPDEVQPSLTSFTFALRKSSETTPTLTQNLNPNITNVVACSLTPFTTYTALVTARTANGVLAVSSDSFTTLHESPRTPVAPVFINSTYTTIAVALEPAVLTAGPLTAYQLQVEKVSAPVGRRKRMTGVPGYVTAELSQADITQRTNFVVGDGKTYGGYTNIKLEERTWYKIHYVVISTSSNVTKYSYASLNPQVQTVPYVPTVAQPVSDSEDKSTLIGVLVALVIFIIIIFIILLIYCWWRRKNRFVPYEVQEDDIKPIELPPYVDDYDPSKYWSSTYNLKDSRHIIAGRDWVYGQQPYQNGELIPNPNLYKITFKDEFQNLPHKSKKATDNSARRYKNFNRFPHLLPYDHSLVELQADASCRRTYINASFIPGYKKTPAYIAAQSPYDEETVLDFWRLIYQRSIKTVVMITNTVEDNIVKCTQYWPAETKASFGHFLLHLTETTIYADYTIRTIEVKSNSDEFSKIVRLFEFTSWPDHGVPDDPIPFLEMRYKVRRYHYDEPTPILVHCGTGMGRTGVFIAVDALINMYAAEGRVQVFDYVRKIRKDRPYMVRTLKQYIFIYEALFEEFHAGNTLVGFDLKERYHCWTQMNPKTEHTYLRDQFRLLEKYNRGPPRAECKTGLMQANVQKNRYLDVIPSEKHRPLLQTFGGPNPTDYINALFLDGYMTKNQFIITQTPLHTTIIDFWKLVYDYDVRTIVMVENFKNEDDSCAEYWPSVNLKQFEPFFIETTAVFQQDNITIRNFKLRSTQNPKAVPKNVRQFQFNAWAQLNPTPQSKTMMMDLIDSVFDWQDEACQNERPVVVHCQDGASHSGLFAILAIICEKMEEEGEVDVYRTIKHCKRRRPQFLTDYDQFRFCYKTLWDFMNLRMPDGFFTETLGQTKNDKSYGVASLNLNSYSQLDEYTSEL
ncbi:receptor-type tyrosine-protein phosphatase kappa-like [Physella acuta]|uniref:receptor-type tyrosine-protein phosphatase kappa-like n=1 Tax=Physella acuta TaxID=109671 RepID=UPI0027DE3068|nr:receptor-type tyrosine-protein phosphatase kappa-like [Physella acuta]